MISSTMISGPNSLYTFNWNGIFFAFFGDSHHSIKGNCEKKNNVKCDTFDYRFEKSIIYDSNCWTIGALLDEWFTYNNNLGILKQDLEKVIYYHKGQF